jgi:hypothetical protein
MPLREEEPRHRRQRLAACSPISQMFSPSMRRTRSGLARPNSSRSVIVRSCCSRRRLEGLAGDRAIGHEEYRRQRDVGLGRHAVQMQHADHASARSSPPRSRCARGQ